MTAGGPASGRRRPGAGHVAATAAALLAGGTLLLFLFVRPGWDGGLTLTARFEPGRFLARLWDSRTWIVPFVAAAALQPALRALVWRAVLPPPPARLVDAYHATALGALVHNVLPGKLGPLAAAWVLARAEGRALAPALSSQLLSKLLELGAVVLIGAAAAAAGDAPAPLRAVVATGAGVFAALVGLAAGVAAGAPRLAARLAGRLPRAGAALAALGEALAAAGRSGRLGPGAALALLPAAAGALAYAVALHGAGVPRSLGAGPLLVAVVTFGQLTPGLPVGAAVTWTLVAWGARQLGVSADAAVALAVVCHAGMVAAGLGVGTVSALLRRGVLRELLRQRSGLGVQQGDRP